MQVRSLLFLGVIGAAVAVGAVQSPAAKACSIALSCQAPVRLFPAGMPVPGNLIFFQLLASQPGPLTLRAADGTVIPASIRSIGGDRVFAPDADVPAGLELRLEFSTVCPESGFGLTPTQQTFVFRTKAAAPLELPTPSLTLVDEGRTREHPVMVDSSVGFVALRYWNACTTCSAAHLTDTHFRVEGGIAQVSGGGVELLTSCDGLQINNSCTGDVFCEAGDYTVEAWSSVVGAGRQPMHATRRVALHCDLDADSNGGLPATAAHKYTPDDPAGCSLRGSQSPAAASAWAMTISALVLRRRRRPTPR
jgi:hypothetical protein